MSIWRKKPDEFEAIQFLGTNDGTMEFDDTTGRPAWLDDAIANDLIRVHPVWPDTRLQVVTLQDDPTAPEASTIAEVSDWIARSAEGVLSVIKPDVINSHYELIG